MHRFFACSIGVVALLVSSPLYAALNNLGSFDINPLKPATNSYGGGGIAFVPAGTDSINQDTLVINWSIKDTIDTTKYNQVFQRITIPGDGGTPTVLATATIRWDFVFDGTRQFRGGVGSDLAFDAVSNRLVSMFNPTGSNGGQCFMSFPLFATDVTVSTLGWSQNIADNSSNVVKTTMVRQDGKYVSLYPYTYNPNYAHVKVVSIDRDDMDGTVALTKDATAQSAYTGWWPNPNDYTYTSNGFNCEGGTAFGPDSFLLLRNFKNASNVQESHLYIVSNLLDAAAVNNAVDLGELLSLNSLVAGKACFGLTVSSASDVAYVRTAQFNNIGNANRVLMVGGLPPLPTGRRNEVMVEDFEDGLFHELPGSPKPDGYGWQKTTYAGQYTWALDATQGANGSDKSMKVTCQTTVPYWYYINPNSRDSYILGGYDKPLNRMEYYIKLPQDWRRSAYTLPAPATYSYSNYNIGTYQRDPNQTLSTSSSTETYGWHFYYQIIFNMYDTSWVRVQLNQWTQHMRNHHKTPNAYPCKPEGDLFTNWTRAYFTGTDYTDDAEVGYPYDIWFDQWSFYYENEFVTMNPEYGDRSATPGSAVSWPVVIRNTHPSENREFGLVLSSELFYGANYWTYSVHLYADANGDGIHQPAETSEPTSTGSLAAGGVWRGVLVVTIPSSGAGSEIGSYVRTAVTAWQKSPVYEGLDPHISRERVKVGGVAQDNPDAVLRGTPCAGAQFFTRTVASPPAGDTTAPAAIDDLCLLAVGPYDAKVRWTAVGNDGETGTAFACEARYSTSPITSGNWDSCTELTGEPDVWPTGTTQTWWMPPVLQPGTTYYLAIKAIDQAGNVSDLSNVVSFTTAINRTGNTAPQAAASANVTDGPTPLAVQFSSAASSDSDGTIGLYVWDFGDGVVSNEANPAHTFTIVGTHTVSLTVFDNAGASHATSLTITTTRGPSGTILLRNGRDGYAGGWTNHIRSGGPTQVTFGGSRTLVGVYVGTNRMLLQFPNVQTSLAIPAGSSIQRARVSLYNVTNSNQIDAEVYELPQSYVPTQASWNNASTGVPWATAGAIPTGATPCAALPMDRHSMMWRAFDVTSWASSATEMRMAVKLVQEATGSPQIWFGAHDDPVVEHRPTLIVDYAP